MSSTPAAAAPPPAISTPDAGSLAEVREALARTPRELPSKYFYDERGSELFEAITRLPEYYLTRAEREILDARAGEIVYAVRPRTLLELGAGSAAKTRLLLDPLQRIHPGATYAPVDVSADFLAHAADALRAEYPALRVAPVVADLTTDLHLPLEHARPMLVAFLGSTIGNFDEPEAIALLRRVRAVMCPGDALLLGTDLRKDASVLHAAYNDAAGVTAEFNGNILRVVNARVGADFDVDAFAHEAIYDPVQHRVEMHLRAQGEQVVHIPGGPALRLRDGESIRTEVSYKYDRDAVTMLAEAAGLRLTRWMTDAGSRFALTLLEPVI
jgi:L-histidine N-alpha-methyltransferase